MTFTYPDGTRETAESITIRPKVGEIWQSVSTGNRWLILGDEVKTLHVLALDGGRFGDATYHFPIAFFQTPDTRRLGLALATGSDDA